MVSNLTIWRVHDRLPARSWLECGNGRESAFLASNDSAPVLVAAPVALECTCISLASLLCWERVTKDFLSHRDGLLMS